MAWIRIIISANFWLQEDDLLQESLRILAVIVLIVTFAKLDQKCIPKLVIDFSQRTYSIYTVHCPVLVSIE